MAFCSDLFLSIRGNIRECMTTPLNKKKVLIFGGIVIIIIIIIIIISVSVNRSSGTTVVIKGSDAIRNHPFVVGGNSMSDLIKTKWKNQINDKNLNMLSPGNDTIDSLYKGYVATQILDLGASDCNAAQYHDAVSQTLDQIDLMHRIFQLNEKLTLVTKAEDIKKAKNSKIIGNVLRVDGGYAIDGKLSIIRTYYNLGVRIFTFTGKCDNPWSKSAWNSKNSPTDDMDAFGEKIIQEANRLGMVIDIAGAVKATQLSILAKSKAPVLLSHSGSSAQSKAEPNNVEDDVLAALKKNKGLLLLSLEQGQVCGQTTPCNITQVIAQLKNLKEKLGVSNVGLGGADFNNPKIQFPTDLKNTAQFPTLFDELFKNKWSLEDLHKLAGENFINLLSEVEKNAKAMDKPMEDLIDKNKFINDTCITDNSLRYNNADKNAASGADKNKTTDTTKADKGTSGDKNTSTDTKADNTKNPDSSADKTKTASDSKNTETDADKNKNTDGSTSKKQ